MFDVHSHLNFDAFKKDYAKIIKRSLDNKIKGIINVGSQLKTSKEAIKIAHEFSDKKIYASIGLHPIYVGNEEFNLKEYQKIAQDFKVKAIGEIGLDYYRISDIKIQKLQKEFFLKQLNLAREFNLPVILHCRGNQEEPLKAYEEMLDILKKYSDLFGVIHCFGANWKIAEQFLHLNFYISFTGIITFNNDKKIEEVIEKIPLNKILAETDCPYLAPVPFRGKRNEPSYIKYIIQKIAEIKKIDFEKVDQIITQNAMKLFNI
ncbi:hydrolase TatD [Candidatus Kuenenbacteria bacterium HGW-Kuenenbacteria-1]|uniref:Hydrolase TatD n=1 Tax=Candidatus Kuenenbacteria bacterium HGW-Kuenenbacteria-1 TaxID=2013812 RepID=A0A2N1UNQ0_9BACT|nr:MAG: hydrolase TatD [Candidatus Kuenenbacteria bacterium HGW-Kuenenbacteria-1]